MCGGDKAGVLDKASVQREAALSLCRRHVGAGSTKSPTADMFVFDWQGRWQGFKVSALGTSDDNEADLCGR